ncbi:hypothetical protein C8J57DRAFT_1185943 [Mycena rebaudengoi]|nr:hypothetical protein C8J57DRAFT_1185943 [Mycena rebaudengoi]
MFSSLFGPRQPVPVSTDRVIPVHFFDDTFLLRTFVMYTLFVFDDVLDPEKLHDSLTQLIKRDGWIKLGGRLRKNNHGYLDYHIPAEFTEQRPAIAFTHTSHPIPAAQHPGGGSKIPSSPDPSLGPSVPCDPEHLSDLVRPPAEQSPTGINSYLSSDRPALGLHVTSFTDKTCISISWPHLAFDAMGKKALLEAWMAVLSGEEDTIPTPAGFAKDPLAELGMHPTEEHVLAEKRVGNMGLMGYALWNIFGLISPKEIRMVCLPKAFWQGMVAQCRAELSTEGGVTPFFTEGDVLVAWWMRLCSVHLPPTSTKTIAANMAVSLRKALVDSDVLPEGQPYIGNALSFANATAPACDVLTKPLSWLALKVREAIASQTTRSQIEAYASLVREYSPGMRVPVLFGDAGMQMLLVSNWQKARLFEIDFAAAWVGGGKGKDPCRASYIQCNQDPNFPDAFPIVGKDARGNYWISGYRAKGLWGIQEREIKRQARNAEEGKPYW